MAPSKAASKAASKTPRRSRRKAEPVPVEPGGEPSVQLSVAGITVHAGGFAWGELAEVVGLLVGALEQALVLRERLSVVPGGAIPYVEDDEGGSRRRVGFTA
jgi:hypothetical protein